MEHPFGCDSLQSPAVAGQRPLPFDPIAEAHRQWSRHGWPAAADGMAVVTSVVRVQQILLTRIERVLRPLGLSFARYELLMLLLFSRHGALPLGKVGVRLQVRQGAVTNAVDRLEADGLVRRRAHDTDGRTTLAVLTARGRRLATKATVALNEQVFAAVELSPDRSNDLIALLGQLRQSAGDFA